MEIIANDSAQDLKKRNDINKLIIGKPKPQSCYYWYYNNELTEDKDIISSEYFSSIKSKSTYNLDKNLKYLKIYHRGFKLEELSNLINLESIEFGHVYCDNSTQSINSKNLKVFVSYNQSFILNMPKLEKIQFNDINRITFDSNPESIKHLITWNYSDEMEMFKNLEIMELRYSYESINENLLIIFKYLKQLKIKLIFFSLLSYVKIENSLMKILNDKIKLKREIDIYLEGVKIENVDKLIEIIKNGDTIWKFRLNNYDLLDSDLSSFNQLDYHDLEKCVNNIENDLPSNFFDKFQYINWVYVNDGVNDVDGLNWFLNNLKYLTELTINPNESLGQVFYNNLPNTIKYLTIHNVEEDINYDFILKLSKLIEFHADFDKDLFDLAFTSFLDLNCLNEFTFIYRGKKNSIRRFDKALYLNNINKELDFNQLIVEFDKIKSKKSFFIQIIYYLYDNYFSVNLPIKENSY